jgi:hypothetical protein
VRANRTLLLCFASILMRILILATSGPRLAIAFMSLTHRIDGMVGTKLCSYYLKIWLDARTRNFYHNHNHNRSMLKPKPKATATFHTCEGQLIFDTCDASSGTLKGRIRRRGPTRNRHRGSRAATICQACFGPESLESRASCREALGFQSSVKNPWPHKA